jgi:hypothetical protein
MITAMPVRDSHAPASVGHSRHFPIQQCHRSKEKLLFFKLPHFGLE